MSTTPMNLTLASLKEQPLGVKIAAGVAAGGALLTAGSCYRHWRWNCKRKSAKAAARPLPEDGEVLRVGFSSKKVPENIDHIIIGSGLSGLYLAALLTKLGHRVLVLEQHYVAGGCTHTFKDKGYEFDTGVHYIGMATQFAAFLDFAAGKNGTFKLERQGREDGSCVYNHVYADDQLLHKYRPGKKTFIKDLVDKFPAEEKAIKKYFSEAEKAGSGFVMCLLKNFMPTWVWKVLLSVPGPVKLCVDKYVKTTFDQGMTRCGIKDGALRTILSAEFGDHSMTPDKAPFFLHATVLDHYRAEGGFSIRGGSEMFAKVLVDSIHAGGGTVLVRAPVDKILVENGRAVGVEMANKKGTIKARRSVISAAGAEVTYRRLLGKDALARTTIPRPLLETERDAVGEHVYLFVGLDGSTKDLKLPQYNLWTFPKVNGLKSDVVSAWNRLFETSGADLPKFLQSDEAAAQSRVPAFVSFPSAKDSTYEERCPGKSSCVMLTESKSEFFGKPGNPNKRGQEYETIKNRYETVLLNVLYHHYPHLKGKVTYTDAGTPYSNEHYLGRLPSYGCNQTIERFLDPSLGPTVQGISNLYLTGQDVVAGGLMPQSFAAILTLVKVLGVTSVDFWLLFTDFLVTVGWRQVFDKTYRSPLP